MLDQRFVQSKATGVKEHTGTQELSDILACHTDLGYGLLRDAANQAIAVGRSTPQTFSFRNAIPPNSRNTHCSDTLTWYTVQCEPMISRKGV